MIPAVRLPDYDKGYDLENARQSSVLILLYPSSTSIFIPFIQRPIYEGVHSGQIGLPGGKMETYDPSPEATALREANEEIGIIEAEVEIIGALTPVYVPPSRFLINVLVGYQNSSPIFIKDDKEVDEIITISVDDVLNDLTMGSVPVTNSMGLHFDAPCFLIENKTIWGATAMIINEFKWILKKTDLETD
ncbi:coenzyme A pyrophosphatase [Solitalea longa]|uniref:Coenzyme A pyrophosphatase n=2 Tax=Solitalea longa TaxID=2079460 RepID=A0A2S5A774_9SPHI|nr:coenzyme A pyrophosphatase [Solitalea longa]